MSTEHKYGAGVYDPHLGFVIAGGFIPTGGVERTYDGISFSNLKEMPENIDGHCLVSLQNGNLVAVARNYGTVMYAIFVILMNL